MLTEILGQEIAEKLSAYFRTWVVSTKNDKIGQVRGQTVALPKSIGGYPPEVYDLRVTARVAALIAGVHERTIYRLRSRLKKVMTRQELSDGH